MDKAEVLDRLISIFLPHRCVFCREVVEFDKLWCGKCDYKRCGEFKCDFNSEFAKVLSATEYNGTARLAIIRIKEKKDMRAFDFFAKEICQLIDIFWMDIGFSILVPVPATEAKIHANGYNQAQVLANCVGKLLGIQVVDNILVRSENTKPQHNLTATQRRVNADQSYHIADGAAAKDKTILLIDDVFTTGATVDACSKKLIEAGANSVFVATAAKTFYISQKNNSTNEV